MDPGEEKTDSRRGIHKTTRIVVLIYGMIAH